MCISKGFCFLGNIPFVIVCLSIGDTNQISIMGNLTKEKGKQPIFTQVFMFDIDFTSSIEKKLIKI